LRFLQNLRHFGRFVTFDFVETATHHEKICEDF